MTTTEKVRMILGEISFYEESDTEEKRAVIQNITGIIDFQSTEMAYEIAEQIIQKEAISYLIPSEYNGDILYASDFQTEIDLFLHH